MTGRVEAMIDDGLSAPSPSDQGGLIAAPSF